MDQNVQLADMGKYSGIQDSPFLEDRPGVGSDPSLREIYNANNLNPVSEPYTSTAVKVFLVIIGIIALVGVATGSAALSEKNTSGTATTRNTVNIDEDGGVGTGVCITTKPSGEYVINLKYDSNSPGAYIRFLDSVVPGIAKEERAVVLNNSKGISGLGEVVANRFLGEVGRSTGIGISDGYFSTLISGGVVSNNILGTCSAIIGGYDNSITDDNSVILGGYSNTIPTGSESGVLLGINNEVNGSESCIIAGDRNTVNASNSGNLAGERNTIGANHSAIAGGVSNQVYDKMSFVAGGFDNSVSGVSSAIIGGYSNKISTDSSVILGGYANQVTNTGSVNLAGEENIVSGVVSGNLAGEENTVRGNYSGNLAGITNQVNGTYSGNVAGNSNEVFGQNTGNVGGNGNLVSGTDSGNVVGRINTVTGDYSGNIAGSFNGVSGQYSGNLAGQQNTIATGANYSAIAGGVSNQVYDKMSFVAGGFDNTVSGTSSSIIGGNSNTVTSDNTVILGGEGLSTSPGTSWSDSLLCGRYNNPVFYPWDISGSQTSQGSCYRFAVGSGNGPGTGNLAFAIDDVGNLYFGTTTGASIYQRTSGSEYTPKTFTIQHPTEEDKWLRHGCLEGPEGGVYYRGKDEAPTTIQLPDYATKIASNFTLQITPIGEPRLMSASEVSEEGSFQVFGNGKFHWTATGERVSINPEPFKKDITIHSMGPYSWST